MPNEGRGPDRPRRKPGATSTRRPYPVLTLREMLIFPLTTFPLAVGREASLRLAFTAWGLLYLIASSLRVNLQARLEVLELDGLRAKYERVMTLLEREIELLELGHNNLDEALDLVLIAP